MGPGSVLGGRYVLRRRLDGADASSTWQAHDETLDRLVHLRAVGADHPHGEAVLDAARRAAAVEDPRLVRVLDVGTDDEITFVVTEWLAADSLETQLRGGPLAADSARTVVGEAALALENARHRGLHHLRLTPSTVRLFDDGTVKVTDLATAAALDGVEVGGGRGELSSDEATDLDTRDLVALAYATLTATWPLPGGSELPAAPLVAGKPVAPAQIVTGAPADLDTLCAQTFAGAGAPDSPGDLARQIAPWGRQRQVERADGTFPHLLAPTKRPPLPTAPPAVPEQHRTEPEPKPVDATSTLAPVAATGVLPSVETTPENTPERPVPAETRWDADDDDRDALFHDVRGGYGDGYDDDPYGDDVVPGGGRTEPGRDDGERRRSGTALALVGVFVAVFLVLAYCGLRGLGDNAFVPSVVGGDDDSSSTTTATTRPSASATSRTSTAPSSETLEIASARGFDPQGDGNEKDDQAKLAHDGKASTAWVSDTYKSPEFGGLKKGVGLLLELDGQQRVSQVKVRVGAGGGTIELRTADGDSLGRVLDTATDAAGTVTLKPSSPVEVGSVVLWFTVPAQVDGGYRAEVAEVTVS
ncbi:hypothetical protein GCM10027446_13390 [Angustibacter peucedani]